jgi:hypothetical protein
MPLNVTHEGADPMGALTTHRGALEDCGAPDCEARARAWVDGDPLMEAMAAAVWELCERSDSGLVIDDPRNIAAAASLAAVRILGRDRCIHVKAVHDELHTSSVADCPWCKTKAQPSKEA